MTAALTMREAAAVVGVHYDTFRKSWRDWRADAGFPAPFLAGPFRWQVEALQTWMSARSAGALAGSPAAAAPSSVAGRGAAARAALEALRAA